MHQRHYCKEGRNRQGVGKGAFQYQKGAMQSGLHVHGNVHPSWRFWGEKLRKSKSKRSRLATAISLQHCPKDSWKDEKRCTDAKAWIEKCGDKVDSLRELAAKKASKKWVKWLGNRIELQNEMSLNRLNKNINQCNQKVFLWLDFDETFSLDIFRVKRVQPDKLWLCRVPLTR